MTAITVYTIHEVDADKLAGVVEEMRTLGAPTIRVVDCGDFWMALEGTHRLHAAVKLGITPDFDVLGQDDLVEADSLDWQDLQSGESYTAGELAGEAFSPYQAQALRFEVCPPPHPLPWSTRDERGWRQRADRGDTATRMPQAGGNIWPEARSENP